MRSISAATQFSKGDAFYGTSRTAAGTARCFSNAFNRPADRSSTSVHASGKAALPEGDEIPYPAAQIEPP